MSNSASHISSFVAGLLRRARGSAAERLVKLLTSFLIAIAPLLAFTSTAARACACGCSVFDSGFSGLPQEDDHGGRIFLEWWHSDQNTLRAGTSNISHDANKDKHITTDWYSIGAQYTIATGVSWRGYHTPTVTSTLSVIRV
jgi:hypothetical protein